MVAAPQGDDALGEVSITVRDGERLLTSTGVAADIVEASVRAYLRAINMLAAGMGAERRPEEFAPGRL